MSRRSRRREREEVDNFSNVRSPLDVARDRLRSLIAPSRSFLQQLEDRREFSPELARPARAFRRAAAKLEVGNARKSRGDNQKSSFGRVTVPQVVRFSDPNRVAVCIRRHQRREVLHALKHVGAGRGVKRPRWSEFSEISCKRK